MEIIGVPQSQETTNTDILSLRAHVRAAEDEFNLAVVLHEAWRPAAYDADLHGRMGVSYATHTFRAIATALRREVLLALVRLWDKDTRAVRLSEIGVELRDHNFRLVDVLAAERAARFKDAQIAAEMREDMRARAKEVTDLIGDYSKGGQNETIVKALTTLRHQRLAHRQVEPASASGPDITDEEIESFYEDNLKIIRLLLSLVCADSSDPEDTAKVYRHYASFF
jgi:acyl-homoserine lactone acylase PvdQ